VVLFSGQSADPEDLRLRLREELSVFKVPQHIFIYDTEEIPRTGSAKIQKPLLREMLAERVAARAGED
jgi:acyl-CoA synthetase (AMP-forming)/AMP-acid ligase II